MDRLREGTEQDLQQIAALEERIFMDAWSLNSIKETFLLPQAFLIVAEQNGKIKGYAIVYVVVDEGEIARIAVEASVRKTGVGSLLVHKVCEMCRRRNAQRLLLDVRAGNEGALTFYRHHGFVEDGIRKGFYTFPQEDAVLMSRSLS